MHHSVAATLATFMMLSVTACAPELGALTSFVKDNVSCRPEHNAALAAHLRAYPDQYAASECVLRRLQSYRCSGAQQQPDGTQEVIFGPSGFGPVSRPACHRADCQSFTATFEDGTVARLGLPEIPQRVRPLEQDNPERLIAITLVEMGAPCSPVPTDD